MQDADRLYRPSGKRSERVIWPIMLGFLESQRYIAGWCELRNDFRFFRTDRMSEVEFLSEQFTQEPGRSAQDLFRQLLSKS